MPKARDSFASRFWAVRRATARPGTSTADQTRSLDEIVSDMRAETPMQRLLLGDVGSGKTVVALLAALHAVESGHQVAFMAPTEILARQHASTIERLVGESNVPSSTSSIASAFGNGRPWPERA